MRNSQVVNVSIQDEYTRNLRRTVMRYINLSTLLVFRIVSKKVSTRYPDYETLVNEALMTSDEANILAEIDTLLKPFETSW